MTNGKLGLALVVLALPINASAEEGRTAGQLMQWCSEVGQKGVTASDPYVNGMCQGTLRGFTTAAEFENARGYKLSVCVPSGTPDIDLIAASNDWASKNPDKNGEPEWFALYNALHFAYPCEDGPLVGVQK
jgi:hypothetical protein